jgi:ribosomal protein S12 methylthiotransferase accessory factor
MKELLQLQFSGGKKVDARFPDVVVRSDQPVDEGGEGSAAQPFQLFLASIATCVGVYAVGFCKARDIATDGLALSMRGAFDEERKRYTKFTLHVVLPDGFPEKYRKAILRVMDQCFVKKHIVDPPEFELIADLP